jgi:uncharacterized membrane protein YciS (DUF1049 family)
MKKKLVIAYFIIGCVWTIIQLPTLLQKTNSNPIKATLLAIFRIVAWPILSGMDLVAKIKQIRLEKQAQDEELAESSRVDDTDDDSDSDSEPKED